MAARHAVDIAKQSLRANSAGQREHLVQSRRVYFTRYAGMFENCFYFRRKDEEPVNDRVEERADAKLIPGQKKRAVLPIVNGKRKLGIQPVEEFDALLFV